MLEKRICMDAWCNKAYGHKMLILTFIFTLNMVSLYTLLQKNTFRHNLTVNARILESGGL